MNRLPALAVTLLMLSPLATAQSEIDCRAIAAATVAELRAGHQGWSDEAEQLARSAAGAACVKASMQLRGDATGSAGLSSTAVQGAEPAAVSQADSDTGESTTAEEDDSSWNPFSDIKFNKVSARPGKKPYERRRESLDSDEE
jgi:hypothetical protein